MWLTQASLNVVGFSDLPLSCYEMQKTEVPRNQSCQAHLLITSAEIPLEHLELNS